MGERLIHRFRLSGRRISGFLFALESEEKPGNPPATEAETVDQALAHSREIKRLESQLQAKQLLVRSYRYSRLPTVDLIAQYNIFARYYYQNVFNPRRY